MGKKKSPPQPPVLGSKPDTWAPDSGAGKSDKVEVAFDTWLDRSLHRLYDGIANEPLPEHLLRLIDNDKRSKGSGE